MAEQAAGTSSRVRLVVEGARLWLGLAGLMVLLVPWGYLLLHGSRQAWGTRPAPSPRLEPALSGLSGAVEQAQGVWGRLETMEIVIAPPLEFVDAVTAERGSKDWFFPGLGMAQFADHLGRLPLAEETRKEIVALARPDAAEPGVLVVVTEDLVWRLSSDERAALYHPLGLHASNRRQSNAFRFAGTVEQWFSGSGLSDKTLELVEKLIYRNGPLIFLADVHALLPRVHKSEQSRLLKALSRERTLELRLRVGEEDDIDRLVQYWGRGRRAKDVRPLLESLARAPGGSLIDVAHLLPSFARARIYTYPTPTWLEGHEMGVDCMWTAFNFFSHAPDNRFAERDAPLAALKSSYELVQGAPTMGDVIAYIDGEGTWFHSAVYVADDVVFTKNGNLFSTPWMYMRMEHMKHYFPRPGPIQVHVWRLKAES